MIFINLLWKKIMLYCNDKKSIFHIHIPRTGGRYIRTIFTENYFDFYFADFSKTYNGVEIPHLHYPLYNNLEKVEESPHFAIVRDPFEKFKSVIQLTIKKNSYPKEIYEYIKNKDWLLKFLDYSVNVESYRTNFFRPQSDFISPKTKIYKFENGFGPELPKWINNNFDLNIDEKIYEKNYDQTIIELTPNEKEIDPCVKDTIKEYYAEDYEKFNYE